jgi:hypothetical protein
LLPTGSFGRPGTGPGAVRRHVPSGPRCTSSRMSGAQLWLGRQIVTTMHVTNAKRRTVRDQLAISRPSLGIVALAVSSASLAVAVIITIVH